jgi:hypothetical protein
VRNISDEEYIYKQNGAQSSCLVLVHLTTAGFLSLRKRLYANQQPQ